MHQAGFAEDCNGDEMGYIDWALLGMVGYSLATLMVKLATRSGEVFSFFVLAIATFIVGIVAWSIAIWRGDFSALTANDFVSPSGIELRNWDRPHCCGRVIV